MIHIKSLTLMSKQMPTLYFPNFVFVGHYKLGFKNAAGKKL